MPSPAVPATTAPATAASLCWLWAALALLAAWPRVAMGAPDPRRTVAVLEYRSGSDAVRDAATRVAALLRDKTSLEVLAPRDARQRYGANLDKEVAECAGNATCIARIGRKVDARQVLLIGISQFGDVILTLQLIDSRRGAVRARIAEALAPGKEPSDQRLHGYIQRVMPHSDFLRYGTLRIAANLTGATVIIAGETRGTTPIEPVRVPAPATYEIRLRKDGYVPFQASVAVPPDAEVEVKPVLELRGAGAVKPWYRRWWVWAIAGTAVAGAAAAFAVSGGDSDDVSVVLDPI